MTKQQIAQVTYEVNAAYCRGIGDNSFGTWEEAPQWQKDTNIAGVTAHLEADISATQSHKNWMENKIKEGWKYGPVKDEKNKTHPALLDYDKLPNEIRVKDFLFKQIVASLKPYLNEG